MAAPSLRGATARQGPIRGRTFNDADGTPGHESAVVNQRFVAQAIGVRMALGAQPEQVLWLVLRRALVQLAIRLPLGVGGAFAVGRLMQSVLAQTSGRDPLTIGGIAMVIVCGVAGSLFWPARRATRPDPVAALRNE